ncbi:MULTISPECIES: ATP-binding protein [Streptomyces]|uniref:ATP-binding protein n=1 Tax=Streptomyces TaxID=1883 RepID=UPI0028AAE931|nr:MULTISPECIES: ATP-binding protein [Streptomyces]MDX2918322.1 ATP-binding protein [Streptomyces sp. NE06-03C]
MTLPRQRGLTEQAADAAIDTACRLLRLPSIRNEFNEIVDRAIKDQMTYRGFLAELLMTECDDRARRRSERQIKAAGFPREKSLRAFDFDANPNIDAATVHTLASCEWIKKSQLLCLIGDSGTGKSHMLIALGTEAAMKGYRVRYTLATKLVNELVEAADEKQLNKTIARYGRVDLLCIDLCRDRDYADNPLATVASSPVWSAFETSRWKGDPLANGVHPCVRAVRMAWATSAGTTGLVVRPNQFSGWCEPVSTTRTVPGTVASSTANVSGPQPFDWQ